MAEPSPTISAAPRMTRALSYGVVLTIPLIAWSRDIAVVTVVLGLLALLPYRAARFRVSGPLIWAGLFLLWMLAAVFWAPHMPWETWGKTALLLVLGGGLGIWLGRPAELRGFAGPIIYAAMALLAVLAVERLTGGFLIGLHRETATVFQRLTALSGGLVLLCCTCFSIGLLLARFVGALIAFPAWICAVLAVSLAYPMDAEVVAVLGGAAVFTAVLFWGRVAALTLMTALTAGMVGWGFLAQGAAAAGLHQWLMDNFDPNWGYRIEIWRYVSELIEGRFIEGHGFDAARAVGQNAALLPSFEGKTSFLHPHNGLLQIWLELGLVGVTLFLGTAISGFRRFLAGEPSRIALAAVCGTITTSAVIWSLSFGVWQGWWLAVLCLTTASLVLAIRIQRTPRHANKRMLFLVTEYYFFEALKKEITAGPRRDGYEILVAARCQPGDVERAGPGVTVIPFAWKRSPSLLVSALFFLPDLVRVGRLFNAVNPDILHNIALKSSVIGSLAALGRDMKVVNAIHGFGFVFMSRALGPRLVQGICGAVLKLSARCNDALIVLINQQDRALVQDRMGVKTENLRLIHGTGIDLARFMPLPDPPASPFRFLVIGRLLYMKGAHVVVEAHRLLRERGYMAELTVCGSPDPENPSSVPQEVLDEWARRPGLTFAGQVTDVRAFLATSHVLVHPSLGGEGLPRALTEAAASERALIATEIPGNTEVVIARETGLLVPPDNAQALADAMQWMIEHPAERLAFARAGRARIARDFSSERVAEAHAALYR